MSSTGWPNHLTFVDDYDSRIQYSAGWQVVTGGAEVEGTKHGADKAGMTATFNFAGTFVSVVGSLGSVDVYGIPTTTYAIDGSIVDRYTAPVLAPGTFRLNQTFFNSPTLDAGSHTLVITNVNGTSPNVVWLDYILFAESVPSPTSSTASSSSASTTGQHSDSPPVQGSHKSNTGAIIGGVVGGIAGFALLVGLLLWWLVRRRRAHASDVIATNGTSPTDIQPFDAWAPTDGPHRPTLPPAPSSYGMTEPSMGPGSALSWSTQPDFVRHRRDPAAAFENLKDVLSSTAELGPRHDGTGSTPPPPYMQ